MKKSIFKITTLLLLLCAAMCSVLGIAACSSEDEVTSNDPIIGTWVATCTNYNYMLGKEAFYYYLTVTTSGAQLTCAYKYDENNGGTDFIRDKDTAKLNKYDDSSDGDYWVALKLSGGDTSYVCVITMKDNDTFELVENYTRYGNSQTYTYTFTRTSMTLDEWKANPTGSAS